MRCAQCNSAPRQRRIHYVLNTRIPRWPKLRVHEFAPFRDWIETKAKSYTASQFYPDHPLGASVSGYRNEDIERLTFPDGSIDLFVVEDLLEHVFDPERATREMLRCLGGSGHILGTVPLEAGTGPTRRMAVLGSDGSVQYFGVPRYHGTPAGSKGSLVVWEYGADFRELMTTWITGHSVEWFYGPMPEYEIQSDRRMTFLITKVAT